MNSSISSSKKYLLILVSFIFLYGVISLSFEFYKRNFLETNYFGEFQHFILTETIEVVNVGTSHGSTSFDWKSQEILNGVNFARSGQPLSYDLFLLEKYSSKIENSIIVVPISFHTLCMETSYFSPVDSIYKNTLPFFGLHQTKYSVEFLINHKNDKLFYDDAYSNPENILPDFYPEQCDKVIQQNNIDYIFSIYERFSDTNRIIIVTTPYYLPSLCDNSGFRSFYTSINKVIEQLEIEYYDYSRDIRFNDINYFYNRDHLNTEGRKLFTEIFIREVLENA